MPIVKKVVYAPLLIYEDVKAWSDTGINQVHSLVNLKIRTTRIYLQGVYKMGLTGAGTFG